MNGIDRFHERCHCLSSKLAICKAACDSDEYCKGFVKDAAHCQIATNSSCPSGCRKYDEGNIGALITDTLWFAKPYEGCFIKNTFVQGIL